MKKKAFIEINGEWIWICEYKNCRKSQKKGYVVCEKHIGANKKDFDRKHVKLGEMIMKADEATARALNPEAFK